MKIWEFPFFQNGSVSGRKWLISRVAQYISPGIILVLISHAPGYQNQQEIKLYPTKPGSTPRLLDYTYVRHQIKGSPTPDKFISKCILQTDEYLPYRYNIFYDTVFAMHPQPIQNMHVAKITILNSIKAFVYFRIINRSTINYVLYLLKICIMYVFIWTGLLL